MSPRTKNTLFLLPFFSFSVLLVGLSKRGWHRNRNFTEEIKRRGKKKEKKKMWNMREERVEKKCLYSWWKKRGKIRGNSGIGTRLRECGSFYFAPTRNSSDPFHLFRNCIIFIFTTEVTLNFAVMEYGSRICGGVRQIKLVVRLDLMENVFCNLRLFVVS